MVVVPLTGVPPRGRKLALAALLVLLVGGILLGLGAWLGRRTAPSRALDFQRLTVRHGTVFSARFAPDGHNVVYSASWDGAPIEIFSNDLKIPGARSVGIPASQSACRFFHRRNGGAASGPYSFHVYLPRDARPGASERRVSAPDSGGCGGGGLVSGRENAGHRSRCGRQAASRISGRARFVRNRRLDQPHADFAQREPDRVSRPHHP